MNPIFASDKKCSKEDLIVEDNPNIINELKKKNEKNKKEHGIKNGEKPPTFGL